MLIENIKGYHVYTQGHGNKTTTQDKRTNTRPVAHTRIYETQVLRIHMSIALLVKVKQNNKYKKQGHLKVSVYTQNVQT